MAMRLSLISHPQSPPVAVHSIGVDVNADGQGGLYLRYEVTGDLDQLVFASPAIPAREHRLWQHSCFEIFLKVPGEEGYQEYNFSPSGAWAAYGFSGRRAGMHDLDRSLAPLIKCRTCDNELVMDVTLADVLTIPDVPMLIGISTIIEEQSGVFSYWAIVHPQGPADFHHSDCFALPFPFEDIAP